MKKIHIYLLAAFVLAGSAAVAQQDFSGPQYAKWGDTPEERESNILASNFLAESVKNKDYDEAGGYLRQLMQNRPEASVNTFKYGKIIYRAKINRSQSRDEKNKYVDSLLMMYDMQAKYFGDDASENLSNILGNKAKELVLYRSSDREGIRSAFRAAIEAGGQKPDPELMTIYFKNLCDDYQNGDVSADDIIAEYERLDPLFDAKDPNSADYRKQFDTAFGVSGVASCENLEKIYAAKLAATPDDENLLKQAVGMMARAKCSSPFFFETAEKYYRSNPSADIAMLLAQIFQDEGKYDKAVEYLNEALNVETNDAEKEKLLVRIGITNLVANRVSDAASAARKAINMNPENGIAYFVLAQCYASSAANCSGISGQAAFWAAYDTMSKAVSSMNAEDESVYGQSARTMLGSYRSHFPTAEECFFNELKEGQRYTVSCGTASGVVTTVRYK